MILRDRNSQCKESRIPKGIVYGDFPELAMDTAEFRQNEQPENHRALQRRSSQCHRQHFKNLEQNGDWPVLRSGKISLRSRSPDPCELSTSDSQGPQSDSERNSANGTCVLVSDLLDNKLFEYVPRRIWPDLTGYEINKGARLYGIPCNLELKRRIRSSEAPASQHKRTARLATDGDESYKKLFDKRQKKSIYLKWTNQSMYGFRCIWRWYDEYDDGGMSISSGWAQDPNLCFKIL